MLPITRATLAEVVGRKVVTWGLIASAVFLGLLALGFRLLSQQFGDRVSDNVQVVMAASVLTGLGLYVVSFLASFLAMIVAAGSVGAEADTGVLQAIIVRPIARWQWFVQRWLAFAGLAVVYVVLMTAAVLLIGRIFAGYRPIGVLPLISLMSLQVVFLLTIGMLLSCRLSAMATGVVAFFYFGISWLGGFIGFVGRVFEQSSLATVGTVVSLLAPSDQIWKSASHFAAPKGIPLGSLGDQVDLPFMSLQQPSPVFIVWACLVTVLALALGARAFTRRDL